MHDMYIYYKFCTQAYKSKLVPTPRTKYKISSFTLFLGLFFQFFNFLPTLTECDEADCTWSSNPFVSLVTEHQNQIMRQYITDTKKNRNKTVK